MKSIFSKTLLPLLAAAALTLSSTPIRAADSPTPSAAPGLASILTGAPVVLSDFNAAGGWQPGAAEAQGTGASAAIKGAGPSTHPYASTAAGAPGPVQSLKVDLKLPSAAGVHIAPGKDWDNLAAVQFAVYLPADAPTSLSLGIYVKDNEWLWYESYPLRAAAGTGHAELVPGGWTTVTVDLRPSALGWTPGGHAKPWLNSSQPLLEFGLLFYSKTPFTGTVEISPLRGRRAAPAADTGPA
ncbi:MAG: hypothetical protein M3Y56_07635, partial [Armatimonadota bacterium]|nr:hypothetical protein [Armatimonadota bacterium]